MRAGLRPVALQPKFQVVDQEHPMRAIFRRYVQYRANAGFWALAAWNGGCWFGLMTAWDLLRDDALADSLPARIFGTAVSAVLFGVVMGGFELNLRNAIRSGREPKP
ncbi:MAG: hypothetical protein JSR45_12870 [Proteobacteria bacterium]|nr:hypothetical protein [Pseudomonadota bacterium]